MSIETLVVAIIIFAVVWLLVSYVVPDPPKQIALWVVYGAAAIWVLTHIHQLLHLQVG
jgi:hypothetical protein